MGPLLNEAGDLVTQDLEKAPEASGKFRGRKTYQLWKTVMSGNS